MKKVLALIILSIIILNAVPTFAINESVNEIKYNLSRDGRVSLNIYDSSGQMVRELLHGQPQKKGAHSYFWDGLDNYGNPVAVGNYTFKILTTDNGLTADFITTLGGNYKYKEDEIYYMSTPPGSHIGPYSVAVDNSGMYILGVVQENASSLIKQSFEGERLWTSNRTWGGVGLAISDGTLYVSQHHPREYPNWNRWIERLNPMTGEVQTNPKTGTPFETIETLHEGVYQSIIDVNGNLLAACYNTNTDSAASFTEFDDWLNDKSPNFTGFVRVYDLEKDQWVAKVDVNEPQGVAVGSDGTIYVSTDDKVVKFTIANQVPQTIISNLSAAQSLAIDNANQQLFVFDGGKSQQIKKYSTDGTWIRNYGAYGGREYGKYVNTNFSKVRSIALDSNGGFYVAEQSAPRRVAHFDSQGKVIKENYGGMTWGPDMAFEPPKDSKENPEYVWMVCDADCLMRLKIDYQKGDFIVDSVFLCNGMADGLFARPNKISVRRYNGAVYVCLLEVESGNPFIAKYDEVKDSLRGVACIFGTIPEWLTDYMADTSNGLNGKNRYSWRDLDGNGSPIDDEGAVSKEEFTFHNNIAGILAPNHGFFAENLDVYAFLVNGGGSYDLRFVKYLAVVSDAGEPSYNLPYSILNKLPNRPESYVFYSKDTYVFPCFDSETNSLYAAVNAGAWDWGTAKDPYLAKWDSKGNLLWATGGARTESRFGSPTGEIFAIRNFVGVAHGCPVVLDNVGGLWNASAPVTYVWNPDGLWVGGLFDNINLNGGKTIRDYWLNADNYGGDIYTNKTTGQVFYLGMGENQGYLYEITGFDTIKTQSGNVVVSTMATAEGTGLQGIYYDDSYTENEKSSRIDKQISFNWGTSNPSGTGISSPNYSASWQGRLKPESQTKISFSGTWSSLLNYTTNAENCHNNTMMYYNAGSASMEVEFTGTSFKLYALEATYPMGGARIYLDEEYLGEFNTKAGLVYFDSVVLWEISGLANSRHTFKLEPFGNEFAVDAIEIDGRKIDDTGTETTFYIKKNGGVRLWIDETLAINSPQKNNDEKSYTVCLDTNKMYDIRLEYYKGTGNGEISIEWAGDGFERQPIPTENLFLGSRYTIPTSIKSTAPGTIQFEDYIDYYDNTLRNTGNSPEFSMYRDLSDGVDIRFSRILDKTTVMAQKDEWLKYSVDVQKAGRYAVDISASSCSDNGSGGILKSPGGQFQMKVDGNDVSGILNVPISNSPSADAIVTIPEIFLSGGNHIIEFLFTENGTYSNHINPIAGFFDYFEFKSLDVSEQEGVSIKTPDITTILANKVKIETVIKSDDVKFHQAYMIIAQFDQTDRLTDIKFSNKSLPTGQDVQFSMDVDILANTKQTYLYFLENFATIRPLSNKIEVDYR